MKSNLLRSVSAIVLLTPAALLTACSTSEGVKTSRADTRAGYDPYGDGVSGGPGTRATTVGDGRGIAYGTRTNEQNNPNWRDGPTRFDNENPSRDNSASQYNTGVTRNASPADGTVNNQNLAKGTVLPQNQNDLNQSNQQLPPQDQNRNWVDRNLNTTNMTTADQQAAARQMSDPATNPTNSNSQFNQANSGQTSTGQNGQDYSTRTYPVQQTNQNYANQTTANSAPSNGVAPLGPQNNWGADQARTQNTNASQNDPANRGSNWQDSSRQAAARQNADPATNPSNSSAQIGQQNAAGTNQPYSSRPTDVNAAGQSQGLASNATADQRILSLLHFKNQKEIEMGRLATTNGSSAAVKEYGAMLVREHTSADARVMAVASQTGTTLLSDTETQNMMRAEKAAMSKDTNSEKMADDSKVLKDPAEELRGLNGAAFDRAFAQKMAKGHEKLAAAIEKALPQVKAEQTRQLLNEMLPIVQKHEKMARQLPGFTETASAR